MEETIRQLSREAHYDDCSCDTAKQYFMALEAKIAWMEQEAHAASVTIERLREELYEIKLAAAGGEDVPGAANMVTANDVEKWVTKYCEEIERLREALRKIRKATYTSDPYYGGADLEVREIIRATLKEVGP